MKYNIETINDICLQYGYSARTTSYNCSINNITTEDEVKNQENWWKPQIVCKTIDDDYYPIGEYIIDRFAICFSGYGTLTLEEENKVMQNLKQAKEMVDRLNAYITICNDEAEKQSEKEFHNNREAFAYIPTNGKNMITFCSTPGLSHREWLIDKLGYSEDEFNKIIRGFKDETGVYFYTGNFETNDHVEDVAKSYKEFYAGVQRVFCGMLPGKIGERWTPIKEIK